MARRIEQVLGAEDAALVAVAAKAADVSEADFLRVAARVMADRLERVRRVPVVVIRSWWILQLVLGLGLVGWAGFDIRFDDGWRGSLHAVCGVILLVRAAQSGL